MIGGIYSGATALDNARRQQELVSNNLANLNTPGYRRQQYSFNEQLRASVSAPGTATLQGASVRSLKTDFTPGGLKSTGRPLDLAVAGPAFLSFQGEQGPVYSRNGVLYRDTSGQLVNGDGLPLLGDGEPIEIPPEVSDRDLAIDQGGRLFSGGRELGKIDMFEFEETGALSSQGQVYFKSSATPKAAEKSQLVQGSRELSNSNPITELITLISGSRNFESAQKAILAMSAAIQENLRV